MRVVRCVLFAFFVSLFCFTSCEKDKKVLEEGLEGRDNYVVSFSLKVDGVEYVGAIKEGEIRVEVPRSVSIKGATVQYLLSEGATISPDPISITDWTAERKFLVTSKQQQTKEYKYTCERTAVNKAGHVVLATQEEVDAFLTTGISEIDGNLTIGVPNGEEITNLKGLSNLTRVVYTLVVNSTYTGENLAGLQNLEQVQAFRIGTEEIPTASKLSTVNLPALHTVYGPFTINSENVKSVLLPKLKNCEGDFIISSGALAATDFNALESVGGSLIVRGTAKAGAKGAAEAEAVLLNSLKHVGGGLTVEEMPKLETVVLTQVEELSGTVSFNRLKKYGLLSMPKLARVGGLDVIDCESLSVIELPTLEEVANSITFSGLRSLDVLRISALTTVGKLTLKTLENLKNVELPLLETVKGNMLISDLRSLKTVQIPKIDLEGNTLDLKDCSLLEQIAGPEEFNGSIVLFQNQQQQGSTEDVIVEIKGVKTLKGNFTADLFGGLKTVVQSIEKDLILRLWHSKINLAKHIEVDFSSLESVRGSVEVNNGLNTPTDYPQIYSLHLEKLKSVSGHFMLETLNLTDPVSLSSLETIGDWAGLSYYFAGIDCPVLKTVNTELELCPPRSGSKIASFSFPSLVSAEKLVIQGGGSKQIPVFELPNINKITQVSIYGLDNFTDFSFFKPLFEAGSSLEEDGWDVLDCGYNPTFDNMKKGLYTKELYDKYKNDHPDYED